MEQVQFPAQGSAAPAHDFHVHEAFVNGVVVDLELLVDVGDVVLDGLPETLTAVNVSGSSANLQA